MNAYIKSLISGVLFMMMIIDCDYLPDFCAPLYDSMFFWFGASLSAIYVMVKVYNMLAVGNLKPENESWA